MNWIWRSCSSPHGRRNRLPPIFTLSTKERTNPIAEATGVGIVPAGVRVRRSTATGQEVRVKVDRIGAVAPRVAPAVTGPRAGNSSDPRVGQKERVVGETVRAAVANGANAGHR